MAFDFDTPIDRHGTGSLKFDCAVRRGKSPDLMPLWVADMDFTVPEGVTAALQQRVAHGIFGYTEPDADYVASVADWMARHHGWTPQAEWLTVTPGVVYALACAVRAYTQPGDAVLIQQPVYYPFSEVVLDNGRRIANAPLTYTRPAANADAPAGAGTYSVDFDAFEKTIVEQGVTLFILCNPHNPVGHAWTAPELERLCQICIDHGVTIISDEIHCDFARPGHPHVSVATLGEEIFSHCVICTSASKTFNLAGLQVSNIFIPDADLRERFRHENAASGYSQANVLGLTATEAAYRTGDAWLDALKAYLEGNLDAVRTELADRAPELRLVEPEGTYLIWVDCRDLQLSDEALTSLVEKDAGLWLDMGDIFGPDGSGFIRINIACPRAYLMEAMRRLTDAVRASRA